MNPINYKKSRQRKGRWWENRDMQKHVRDPVSFVCLWGQREGPPVKVFMQLLESEQTQRSSILASSEGRQHSDLSIEIHWDPPHLVMWRADNIFILSSASNLMVAYCRSHRKRIPFLQVCLAVVQNTLRLSFPLSVFFFSGKISSSGPSGSLPKQME